MVYREPPPVELSCPRCKKRKLPPVEVAACACGTWVSAFAADIVLTATDRKRDPITRWWRVLEPCPLCEEKMQLHGEEPGLLLGCTGHGYWIDADTIEHTGLAEPFDAEALERKRNDDSAIAAATEERERAELQRANDRATRERAEAAVRHMTITNPTMPEIAAPGLGLHRTTLPAIEEPEVGSDPFLWSLWRRVAALEQRNAELEDRIAALEGWPARRR